jgi:hypothetical protein
MKRSLLAIVFCLILVGCSQNPKPVTGAVNQFDSDSYLALVTTDAVIQQTKAGLNAGSFPTSYVPAIKSTLNNLIVTYDIADTAYGVYHAAAVAGTVTAAQKAAVSSGLTSIQNATSALVTAKGGQ